MECKKMTVKELRWLLMSPLKVNPVFLKEVTEKESRIIDAYRLVNKDEKVDFLDNFEDQNKIFNVLTKDKKILIWD